MRAKPAERSQTAAAQGSAVQGRCAVNAWEKRPACPVPSPGDDLTVEGVPSALQLHAALQHANHARHRRLQETESMTKRDGSAGGEATGVRSFQLATAWPPGAPAAMPARGVDASPTPQC